MAITAAPPGRLEIVGCGWGPEFQPAANAAVGALAANRGRCGLLEGSGGNRLSRERRRQTTLAWAIHLPSPTALDVYGLLQMQGGRLHHHGLKASCNDHST